MRSSIPTAKKAQAVWRSQHSVAIPFKWGQVFQPPIAFTFRQNVKESQSLLNEVKYSNKELQNVDIVGFVSRNPF